MLPTELAGPLLAYLLWGLFIAVTTTDAYVRAVRPSARQFGAYVLLCVFAWPYLLWLILRAPHR